MSASPAALSLLLLAGLALAAQATETESTGQDAPEAETPAGAALDPQAVPAEPTLPASWGAARLLGDLILPGERRRLMLLSSESFAGADIELPVLALRGPRPGPTLCLTAGVHGDELNGIEIVRQIFEHTKPSQLSGMLIGVPVVNLHGFRRNSRYLPDRRDLNRYFPGHPSGSSASRIANAVFEGVLLGCNALVDLHTGTLHRSNLPQVRADLRDPRQLDLARSFGIGVVVHNAGAPGTLRRAAQDAGIRAITYEAGEPMRFQREEIERGVQGVRSLMASLGLSGAHGRRDADDHRVYFRSRWVRVDEGGIFLTDRRLGERVQEGDLLGTVTDPISNERSQILAPVSGRILGMALPQVVIPGFATFHIGIDAEPGPDVSAPPPSEPSPHAEPTPDQLDLEENPE
jgi:predicted deacylase